MTDEDRAAALASARELYDSSRVLVDGDALKARMSDAHSQIALLRDLSLDAAARRDDIANTLEFLLCDIDRREAEKARIIEGAMADMVKLHEQLADRNIRVAGESK